MKKAFVFVALLFVLCAPTFVFAQGILEGPLAPTTCGGEGQIICQLCDLVSLVNRLLNFAVAFTVVVATLMFAYAGILYVTAAANPKNIQKAHGVFMNDFAGLMLVLVAWLIVNILLSVLTGRGLTDWSGTIGCVDQTMRTPPASSAPGAGSITTPQTTGQSCADILCVGLEIPTTSSTCLKDSAGKCLVTRATNLALVGMANNLTQRGLTFTATAAIGGNHVAACQNPGTSKSGTCIDAVVTPFVGGGGGLLDAATIRSVIDAGNANGLRAEYEVPNQQTADTIRAQAASQGITLGRRDVLVVSAITGPHFSVYLLSANPAPF